MENKNKNNKENKTKKTENKRKTPIGIDDQQIDKNKSAQKLFKSAKRFANLNELELALENIEEALSIDTVDDDDYNQADAYFLATQICRRAKEYTMALKFVEEGIKTVNPYRPDGPKFVLAKGVTLLQLADAKSGGSKRKKHLDKAIDSFKMAVTVSEVLLNQKVEYRFEPKDISTIKRYLTVAIYDSAYANDLLGNRRQAIEALDRLFEFDPHFSVPDSTFELYHKIRDEKRVLHIAK
ncbi:MAG: hypothetical protein U9Q92_03305 [archaeon]|nr:hypothetical protein [archaeon]